MIDHDNCIFEDKYSTNISLDIFKKVLVPGLSHNGSHADIQYIIYTGNQKFFNWLMGPVFHREYCHSYPHHLCLNLRLYFLGLLHAFSLCDVSGCVWHQTSCHILHILHLSGRSCAFQVVLGLGNWLASWTFPSNAYVLSMASLNMHQSPMIAKIVFTQCSVLTVWALKYLRFTNFRSVLFVMLDQSLLTLKYFSILLANPSPAYFLVVHSFHVP